MTELITPDELPRWVPGELTLDSAPFGWDGVRIRGYRYPPLDVPIPGLQDYLVVVYQEGATPMNRRSTGDWCSELVSPGSISLLTHAAQSHWGWSEDIAAAVADVAAQACDRHVREVELFDVLRTEDPVLSVIAATLARESRAGELGGWLYVDSLKHQACVHMLRHYANVRFHEPTSYGGLSGAQCHKLIRYIDDHLDQNISLADMAGVVQLSVFHFIRKFRTEFGCPPHAYVMRRRIEHAKRQMERRSIPLTVVAANRGFSDQSHMTRLFRRLMGTTPAEYRTSVTG